MEVEADGGPAICEIPESGSIVDSHFLDCGQELVTVSSGLVTIWILEKKNGTWEQDAQWDCEHQHPLLKVNFVHQILEVQVHVFMRFSRHSSLHMVSFKPFMRVLIICLVNVALTI